MEKNAKRIRFLLLALGLILFLILFGERISSSISPQLKTPFSSIKKESINTIEVVTEATVSALIRKNNVWYVTYDQQQYRADEERISELLDELVTLKVDEVVSRNKKKHQEFGIGKQKIGFQSADKTYNLYIGNSNGTSKSYARVDNQDEVFLLAGIDSAFYPNDYRDLAIATILHQNKVRKIRVTSQEEDFILVRTKDKWYLGKKQISQDKIDLFVSDIMSLRAINILPPETGLPQSPALTLRITENNREKILNFFSSNSDTYLMKGNDGALYEVSSGTIDLMKKNQEDF